VIDYGNSFGLATDQRGQPRPFVYYPSMPSSSGGDGSDIGAVELIRPQPHLSITPSGGHLNSTVQLSWTNILEPTELESILEGLEGANALGSGGWTALTNRATLIGNQYVVSDSINLGVSRFYRLKVIVTNVVVMPWASTWPATQVSTTGVTLNGSVFPNGADATYWFEYGMDTNYAGGPTSVGLARASNTNILSVSNTISGLASGTLYHFQLVASNSAGINYGGDQSFTTISIPTSAPVVATLGTHGVTSNSAWLLGSVNPEGGATTAWFIWNTTSTNNVTAALPAGNGTNSGNFVQQLTGLMPGYTYNFAIAASNSAGTTYGANQQFVTPGPPLAGTGQATLISSSGATIGGYVYPNGLDTTAWFEYGTDTNYTAGTIGTTVVGASNLTGLAVSSAITGLTANTNYHFQLMASNSLGISYGGDESFSTPLGALPVVVTGSASNVTTTSALLSGTVNPEGIDTMGYFYYYSPQTGAYGFSTPQAVGSGTAPIPFSLVVTGLAPNTLYNFQAAGTNTVGSGAGFGSYVPFTTPGLLPDVVTLDATYTNGIPVINGTVNGHGTWFNWTFEIGYSPDHYTWTVGGIHATNNSPQLFSVIMTDNPNLFPSTTYYYTLQADNAWGSDNSPYIVKSFTTPP
jgi:hypothetical protein